MDIGFTISEGANETGKDQNQCAAPGLPKVGERPEGWQKMLSVRLGSMAEAAGYLEDYIAEYVLAGWLEAQCIVDDGKVKVEHPRKLAKGERRTKSIAVADGIWYVRLAKQRWLVRACACPGRRLKQQPTKPTSQKSQP